MIGSLKEQTFGYRGSIYLSPEPILDAIVPKNSFQTILAGFERTITSIQATHH